MVQQYRDLGARESLELPGGSVKDGATSAETARHALVEETGYTANHLVLMGIFNPCNGLTDETCQVSLAWDLQYVGSRPDDTEAFEVLPLSPQDIEEQIRCGAIWDGMTFAVWRLVQAKRPLGLWPAPGCPHLPEEAAPSQAGGGRE
jgi:ADP-ribose pyrophosphatase